MARKEKMVTVLCRVVMRLQHTRGMAGVCRVLHAGLAMRILRIHPKDKHLLATLDQLW